jgi:hypothetical protein
MDIDMRDDEDEDRPTSSNELIESSAASALMNLNVSDFFFLGVWN